MEKSKTYYSRLSLKKVRNYFDALSIGKKENCFKIDLTKNKKQVIISNNESNTFKITFKLHFKIIIKKKFSVVFFFCLNLNIKIINYHNIIPYFHFILNFLILYFFI